MKQIVFGVREFQAQIGEALRAVRRGERVIVTSHGRPVAVLSKAESKLPGESAEERILRRMAAEGRVRLGRRQTIRPFKPPLRTGGLSAQVIADRR